MRQYCRYCSNLCYGDSCYCAIKKKTFSESTVKAINKCKDFELNPIDALGKNLKVYNPRKNKEKDFKGQTSFFS